MNRGPLRVANTSSRAAKYSLALGVGFFGLSFAAVPLYKIYCQSTGKGGAAFRDKNVERIETMEMDRKRKLRITFTADTASRLAWKFKPTLRSIDVHPGETTLAFFTAKNPLDIPVDGVATYAVVPVEAGAYLNKIQCFCFEEQRLNPKEEVDLPVFFYIDPSINEDPVLSGLEEIVLEYKFWTTKEGMNLPFIDKLKAIVA